MLQDFNQFAFSLLNRPCSRVFSHLATFQVTPDGECAITPANLQNNRCDCPGRCVDEVLDPRAFRPPIRPPSPGDPNPCICQRNDNLQPAQCPQSCGEIVEECPFVCEPRITLSGLEAGSSRASMLFIFLAFYATEKRFFECSSRPCNLGPRGFAPNHFELSPCFEVPCHIPRSAIRDGRCDCPGECDDEEGSFTCNEFEPVPNTNECFCFFQCLGSIELDLSPCPGSFLEGFCKNFIRNNGPSICEITGFQQTCAEYCPPQTASLNSGVTITPKMREEIEALSVAPYDRSKAEKLMAVALNQTQKALQSPAKPKSKQSARAERKLSESLPSGSGGNLLP